jgi:hypothetical protein
MLLSLDVGNTNLTILMSNVGKKQARPRLRVSPAT